MSLSSILIACCLYGMEGDTNSVLRLETLPSLPVEIGLVQMYAGVSGGALIAAGGARLSDQQPDALVASESIFVLENPEASWRPAAETLPTGRWAGVSVSYRNRDRDDIILVGGTDGQRYFDDVLMLRWENGQIITTRLPPIPEPIADMCGAVLKGVLYIAGGRQAANESYGTRSFWALDLSGPIEQMRWSQLVTWPGPGRYHSVAAVQDGSFFLIGGTTLGAVDGAPAEPVNLRDAYRFTPTAGRPDGSWKPIAELPYPVAAAPSPAPALGQAHLVVLGGATRPLGAGQPARIQTKSVSHDLLLYHTVTNTWTVRGSIPPEASKVLAPAADWQGGAIVAGGRPATERTSTTVLAWRLVPRSTPFGWVGWSVVAGYFAALLGMGYYFSKRERSTDDFFFAGRRIPWWAVGLSIFGTQLSAITFIAIPGVAYATDWVRMLNSFMILAVLPVVIFVFLPFFCRLHISTAYEYLELRFSPLVRTLSSAVFIIYQLMRVGVVVYLPSLALAAVTGADIVTCVVAMALVSTVYTVMGGIEAVIWTDVLQVIVLLGGALLSLAGMIYLVGGIGQTVSIGAASGKFHTVNWGWDPTELVLWVMIVGPFFASLQGYVSDQTTVQRYLATADEKQAARGMWLNVAMVVPVSLLFYGIGSALFAYYKTFPERIGIGKNDEVFPWFIVDHLPSGISGLVIAAVFAASMSSLDSSMNSVATAVVCDFYRRWWPAVDDARCLRLARWITIATGFFGGIIAILLAKTNISSIWDTLQTIFGFFGGPLLGVFLLAAFTKRTHSVGALLGLVAGTVTTMLAVRYTALNFMLYGMIGTLACFFVGILVSFVVPIQRRNLNGLTVWTMGAAREDEGGRDHPP